MDLSDVAHELYALAPGDFTAERNERAKELKAEDPDLSARVKALGKPTTAAWLVNQLVRHHGDEVEQVAQIGSALREAQEGLEKDELLQLNKQRHGVLRAVTRQARALASELGHPVSTAIADEVESTLRAVMSDPDAADAVRTGTLLRSLSGTGLGAVDLQGAVAVPEAASPAGRRSAPTQVRGHAGKAGRAKGRADAVGRAPTSGKDELAERRRAHEEEERERERARQEREQAEKVLAEARRQESEAEDAANQADDALDEAQASVDELQRRQATLEQRLHDLEQQAANAQSELTAVQREHRTAERDRDQARHESKVAHRSLDRARQRVERLS